MEFFGAAHGWGLENKNVSLPKICHTYHAMMKNGTTTPYLKKPRKHIYQLTHSLSSADISIFSPEISNFCYIKKYSYRLHFNT